MKKFCLLIAFLSYNLNVSAQEKKGYKQEQLFIGSGINLGFFNGFVLGLNPEIGYSFNKFIDAGVSINFSYITQNYTNAPITDRYLTVGGGPYLRIWPVNMLYLGGQLEYNRISYSQKQSGTIASRIGYNAPSLLVGGGYGSRFIGQSQFYTSIMVDVLKDPKSPYVDQFNRSLPVFRTAFLFYLRPKKERN